MKQLRNTRWEKAFAVPDRSENPRDTTNRKATIVIEHLIQASDVAHTMQHWHIYRKWNECLFEEMYKAFREGRSDKDPKDFWYKGEIVSGKMRLRKISSFCSQSFLFAWSFRDSLTSISYVHVQ